MKKTIIFTLALFTMILSFVGINAATYDSGTMVIIDDLGAGVFDIKGYHEGTLKGTTYLNRGYKIDIIVDGTTHSVPYNLESNEVVTIGGLDFKLNLSFTSDNNYINLEYTLVNNSGTNKTYSIGTHGDTKIGDNDAAELVVTPNGLVMYEGDATQAQFNVILSNSYGVTDVDTYWIGSWSKADDNAFNQSTIESYNSDSGFAFSWKDRSINDGETKTHKVMMGIGDVNDAPVINSSQTGDLGEFSIGDTITLSGSVSDPDGDTYSLYYSIDGEEYTNNPVTVDGSGNYLIGVAVPDSQDINHTLELVLVDEHGAIVSESLTYTLASDSEAPVITASGETVNTEDVSTWTPTYSANDNIDGDVTSNVGLTYYKADGTTELVDIQAARDEIYSGNNIQVKYTVSDAAGNSAEETVVISSNDNTVPTFDSIGTQYVEINSTPLDWTSLITNANDNAGNASLVYTVESNTVDYTTTNTYSVTVRVTDGSGNYSEDTFDVIVQDTIAPTGNTIEDQTMEVNGVTPDWSALITSTSDNSNGTVTVNVYDNLLDITQIGTYQITIGLEDESGNESYVYFSVEVVDTIAPTFDDIEDQTLEVGSAAPNWANLVVNATDNSNGVTIVSYDESLVDYNTVGTYEVSITVQDNTGNATTKTFDLYIVDTTAPTFDDINIQYVEINSTPLDWTTLVTNASDNYSTNLTYATEANSVDYTTVGLYSVTVRVTDEYGNYSEDTFSVEVQDTQAPTGNSIEDQTMEINGIVPDWAALITTTTDNSNGTVIVTAYDNLVDYTQLGTYLITIELEDESGNVGRVYFNVTIEDTTAPTYDDIEDQTLEVGSTAPNWANLVVNATDNSNGGTIVSYDDSLVDYNTVGTYQVSITVQDHSGNKKIKTFDVHVGDTFAPTFDDIDTQYVEINSTPLDWTSLITNASDNVSINLVYSTEADSVVYTIIGTYSVTVRVTDEQGNYSEDTFDVVVQDTQAPTGNSIEDQTMEINSNVPDWASLITSTSDNSNGTVTVNVYDNLVDYTQLGTYMITIGLEDESGNETYIYFDVTIEDTIAPTYDDIEDQTIEVGSEAPIWGNLIQNIQDNGNLWTISSHDDSLVDYDTVGVYEVSVTVQDYSGNMNTKTFNVTVEDTTSPVFDSIETQYVEINGGSYDWTLYIANAEDNSGNVSLVYSVETSNVDYTKVGTYTVTVRVTDASGNYSEDTFDVVVQDTQAPTGNSIEDQTMEINSIVPDWATLITTTSDNSNGTVTVNVYDNLVDYTQLGTYLITIGLEDESGNETYIYFNLTIEDTIAPTFDDIDDQTIEVKSEAPFWGDLVQNIEDNGNLWTISSYDDSLVDYDTVGIYEVSVTVQDHSGNKNTKTFNVHVQDTVAPTFDDIADQTIEAGVESINWDTYVNNALDNSEKAVTITFNDVVDYDTPGTYTINITVTDESGNYTTKSFDVVVEDTTAPTFSDVSIPVFEAGDAPLNIDIDVNDSNDNSDGDLAITYDDEGVDYDTPGTYSIDVTVTDESGNATTHSIEVTVEDTTAPAFDDVDDQTIEAGSESQLWNTLVINIIENSDGDVVIAVDDTVDYDTPGTYVVTLTATDESGNHASKSFNVVVEDTTAPTFDDVDSQTIESGSSVIDWATLVLNIIENSDGTTVATFDDVVDYNTPGTYEITLTVTDESGNYTSKSFNVVVEDTIAPTFDDVNSHTVEAGTIEFNWSEVIENLNDNSDTDITITYDDTTVDYNVLGTYTVTVTATDESGNYTTKSFSVTVEDTTPPVITNIPLEIDIEFEESIDLTDLGLIIEDNLDGLNASGLEVNLLNTEELDIGEYEVIYEVTDQAGNVAQYTITLNVQDTTPPVILLVEPIIVKHGTPFDLIEYIKASDNYDGDLIEEISFKTPYEFSTVGNYNVTLIVEDNAGNVTETDVQVKVVIDPIPYSIIGGLGILSLGGIVIFRRFF